MAKDINKNKKESMNYIHCSLELCEPHGCLDYSQGYDRCENQCKKCKDLE